MDKIDRADFAVFLSMWIASEKYKLGLIDEDVYIETLRQGTISVGLMLEQIKVSMNYEFDTDA